MIDLAKGLPNRLLNRHSPPGRRGTGGRKLPPKTQRTPTRQIRAAPHRRAGRVRWGVSCRRNVLLGRWRALPGRGRNSTCPALKTTRLAYDPSDGRAKKGGKTPAQKNDERKQPLFNPIIASRACHSRLVLDALVSFHRKMTARYSTKVTVLYSLLQIPSPKYDKPGERQPSISSIMLCSRLCVEQRVPPLLESICTPLSGHRERGLGY